MIHRAQLSVDTPRHTSRPQRPQSPAQTPIVARTVAQREPVPTTAPPGADRPAGSSPLPAPTPAQGPAPTTSAPHRRLRPSLVITTLVPLVLVGLALGVQWVSPLPGVTSPVLYIAALAAWWLVTVLGFAREAGRRPSWKVPVFAAAAVIVVVAVVDTFASGLGPTVSTVAVVVILGIVDAVITAVHTALRRERVLRVAPAGQPVATTLPSTRDRRVLTSAWPQGEDTVSLIVRAAEEHQADVVEVGPELDHQSLEHLSWELRELGASLDVRLVGGWTSASRLRPVTLSGAPALRIAPPRMGPLGRGAKRTVDILGSGALLVLCSPVLLVAAIAVKAHDRGPVFFRQERVGMDGRPFRILKFRTMEIDADAKLFALLREQEADGTPLFKVQDDPRITRVGGFLRKYSIDELPQLLNVLGGTMSLVGPRPQRKEEVDLYTGNAGHRLGVRPGMTGLWQVSGRSNLGWEEGQQLDIAYAHNASFFLDTRILLRTVSVVLRREGAV